MHIESAHAIACVDGDPTVRLQYLKNYLAWDGNQVWRDVGPHDSIDPECFYRVKPGVAICENCGDTRAELDLKEVSLCQDCARQAFAEALSGCFHVNICGQPLFKDGRLHAICVMRDGSEHDHE